MSLLAPLGLLALLAIPAIIVFHMRDTTPRVLPIPSLRFWSVARPRETEQMRWRRPPLSLLLLLQLAVAAALALSLARPVTERALGVLGLDLRTEPRNLILLLDGSTSMGANAPGGGTRYDAAKAEALRQLATLREGDVATVLLMGTRDVSFGATDSASLGQLRQRLAAAPAPGGRADLDAALDLARDLLIPGMDDRVSLVTDGALTADASLVAHLGAPVDLTVVGAAPDGAPPANAAVVEIASRPSADSPGLSQLYARVANFGPAALAAPVVLTGDGLELARQTVDLPPDGGTAELTWALPQGTADVTVALDAPDLFPADNRASLVLPRADAGGLGLSVLLLSDAPGPLQRALGALPGAEVTTAPADGYADAAAGHGWDLVVFDRTLPPPQVEGALPAPALFVDPPAGGPFTMTGTMDAPTVSRLEAADPLLAGVDLAGVTFGETPALTLRPGQEEVVGAQGGPLVFRAKVGGQPSVVLAFDLAQSNLPRRVAFPILVANIAAELAPSPLPPSVPLGDPLAYRPRTGTATVRVAPPQGDPVDLALAAPTATAGGAADAAPEPLREVVFTGTGTPGRYRVSELDATGRERGGGEFTVNAGHPTESDLRPNPDLAPTLATATGSADPGRAPRHTDLWPLLVLLALGLLGLEWIVTLTRRRAEPRRPEGRPA